MLYFLTVIFILSLIYASVTERFRVFSRIMMLQGILLFGISVVMLQNTHIPTLIFIAVETLVFKAIVVPFLLYRIINNLRIFKVHQNALPGFYSLILAITGLILSIVLIKNLSASGQNITLFTSALFCLYVGLMFIITHKLIFSHMIGFLIIENAVFLFSLAFGTEKPMMINIGILLDIFVSVLIITMLISKIGSKFQNLGTDSLTNLKD